MRQPFRLTPEMMNEIESATMGHPRDQARLPLLEEREHTHGSFHNTAALAQTLKGCFRTMPSWPHIEPEQREAVDLICTKLARIMAGDPRVADHWHDIAGYAELGAEVCDK